MRDLQVVREFLKWVKDTREIELCYPTEDCDDRWANVHESYIECMLAQFEEQNESRPDTSADSN